MALLFLSGIIYQLLVVVLGLLVLWVRLVCIDFLYLSSCITQFEYFLLTGYPHPLDTSPAVPVLISFRFPHAQQCL